MLNNDELSLLRYYKMVPKRKVHNGKKKKQKKIVICVSGTPGTGKTTLSKAICEKFGLKYVDLNEVLKRKASLGYDEERDSYIIDEEKINKEAEKLIRKAEERRGKGVVFDSHLSHFISPKNVDLCIICTCELKELRERLKRRGYKERKIRENLEAEIFQVCEDEAKEIGHHVKRVDCSKGVRECKINEIMSGLIKP